MSAIEWRHDGRQPLFKVRILRPEPSTDVFGVSARALLDTGSTASGITQKLASRLGLIGIGKRPLVSARSDDQAERYIFRVALDPDDNESAAMPFVFEGVIGFELRSGFHFDALIGMDILRQCDVILERTGRCKLIFGR